MHRVFLLLKEIGLMRETVGHIFMGRRERENGRMASVDSGKGLRPAGECFTAHLKGNPVSYGFSSSCSCLWARVSPKHSFTIICFLVTLHTELEFQRFSYQ